MKKYLSLIVLPLFVLVSQSALAGKCELDTDSPVITNTTQILFDPFNTMQSVTVVNAGLDQMTVYPSLSGRLQWFDQNGGCDGAVLNSGSFCTIQVNFYPGNGAEQRQYHKRLVITGETATGEFSQVVCLDATN